MPNVDTDLQKIEALLNRGVHEVYTREDLKKKLESGNQLHIKLGIDVTGPDLHLGHTVVQRKLRDFQELGHKVTLIIGDFTTLVGDHSDKVDMRDNKTSADIKKDEETYKEQFFKTVVEGQTEVRRNSEWLKGLNFNDIIDLAKQFTVAQMLDRESFLGRYKDNKPIGLDEFLYPLMQGYDSVALKCDVEIGGTDQTFNLLAGRKIMPSFDLEPQIALTTRLLTGSDGKPMGKSLENFITILAEPFDMYGDLMSIVDDVICEYFELITRVPMEEIEKMKIEVESGANPIEFKKQLAKEVVTFYHSEKDAEKAEKIFEETVQEGGISDDLVSPSQPNRAMSILEFLKNEVGNEVSSSEIKRVIQQGGVEVNGEKVTDPIKIYDFNQGDMIKFRKREFFQVE